MSYTLHFELHPLGVIVQSEDGERELLIPGETCCCLSFEEMTRIAATTRKIVLDEVSFAEFVLSR